MSAVDTIGGLILVAGLSLVAYSLGWLAAVGLFLALFGNNMQQRARS